jgi:hypothetical protein
MTATAGLPPGQRAVSIRRFGVPRFAGWRPSGRAAGARRRRHVRFPVRGVFAELESLARLNGFQSRLLEVAMDDRVLLADRLQRRAAVPGPRRAPASRRALPPVVRRQEREEPLHPRVPPDLHPSVRRMGGASGLVWMRRNAVADFQGGPTASPSVPWPRRSSAPSNAVVVTDLGPPSGPRTGAVRCQPSAGVCLGCQSRDRKPAGHRYGRALRIERLQVRVLPSAPHSPRSPAYMMSSVDSEVIFGHESRREQKCVVANASPVHGGRRGSGWRRQGRGSG